MKLTEVIIKRMKGIRKSQMKFIVILLNTMLSLSGRITFSNLSRYSQLSEKTYSRNFRRYFDFVQFNSLLMEQVYDPKHEYLLALDASFIPKSGKTTYGRGTFWNSIQGRSMKGLEISTLALVDVTGKTAYTISVKQVPPSLETSEENAIDFFLSHLNTLKQEQVTIPLPQCLVGDGFFAKKRFIDGALSSGRNVISKLRKDANLNYLYKAPKHPKRKRGRPRQFAGKMNVKSPDLSRFHAYKLDDQLYLYSGIVYSVSLKRKIHLVYLLHIDSKGKKSYALLFSTDLTMDAQTIYRFYSARFQIEFIFRDAKQFTGLTHCQARNQKSLDFHFNASLSLLNLARIEYRVENATHENFSMASWKRRSANEMILNQHCPVRELRESVHVVL